MDWQTRKRLHIEAIGRLPSPRLSTLLETVKLERGIGKNPGEVQLATEFLGIFEVRAPIMVASMTGGIPEARAINHALADLCEAHGIPFASGSMSPYLKHGATDGFDLRKGRDGLVYGGNVGAILVAQMGTTILDDLVGRFGLDFMCIHINPLHELAQPEGDREFGLIREGIAASVQWSERTGMPVLIKEVGHGFSRRFYEELLPILRAHPSATVGVDVAGAGGTDFIDVELMRRSHPYREEAERLKELEVPTLHSLLGALKTLSDVPVVASGGIRTGLDVAKVLHLGAHMAAMASPWLAAYKRDGRRGLETLYATVVEELKRILSLVGPPHLRAAHIPADRGGPP